MAPVTLHLYDLSQGMARTMSMAMIGKQLDGIWHSGIAVFGVEYFYGGGICAAPAGRAIPHLTYQEIALGETSKTQVELETFLQSINHRFTQATYSLLRHNCNNFANEVSNFLIGKGIPEHIVRLPQEFLSSPMGAALAPMIEGMEQRMREELVGGGRGLNPFSHIQGRVPLFPPAPSVSDQAKPSLPISADDNIKGAPVWIEGDTGLLKTAVDGIPATIMSSELKAKVAGLDAKASREIVSFMKAELKDKPAILLTFTTIIRFFWKIESFRDAAVPDSRDLLINILSLALRSSASHVVTAGLTATANVSACIGKDLVDSFLNDVVPLVIESQSRTSTAKKLLSHIITNTLASVQYSEARKTSYTNLLHAALDLASELIHSTDSPLLLPLLDSIERVCSTFITCSAVLNIKNVDPEGIIDLADKADKNLGFHMPNLIRLIVE